MVEKLLVAATAVANTAKVSSITEASNIQCRCFNLSTHIPVNGWDRKANILYVRKNPTICEADKAGANR